ncbi:unnamed protein product [Callosobruchus maculatus]|uniref:DUF7869 domain-containing protein n=1 Tax=Callosobruchus maculatus TaxID=64391 RepID=A0A653CAD7_CALMS|nr:unnamed protein product [Callosobruchus maculatus]
MEKEDSKKIKKELATKQMKVSGVAHLNHVGKRLSARQTGPDCSCLRFKCFTTINENLRQTLLTQFNSMTSKDEQDAHLVGLIAMSAPERRRPRKILAESSSEAASGPNTNMMKAFSNSATYSYKIRADGDEYPVCFKAFLSIFGVTRARVRRLQQHLLLYGKSPHDMRGKHNNRPKKTPNHVLKLIESHISSFKARQSHYSRRKNPDRLYLPEMLSVKTMYKMFLNKYRIKISYKEYWSVFNTSFNIKFGLPRSDTCTICDRLMSQQNLCSNLEERRKIETERNIHLCRADKFYEIKRKCKLKAQQGLIMCLSFDYMQNLPLPHIQSSEVFFASQLWYYVFGVHDLATNDATIFVYDETTGKKGQNDVTSLLLQYFNKTDVTKDDLVLFSDGCPGQNKNYVMVRFLYALVHIFKVFKTITYYFPIRGHSRLPNDQYFSLIEAKKRKNMAEVQSDWDRLILEAREKPSPFNLVKVPQSNFFNMSEALKPYFLSNSKPPMKIKGVRVIRISADKDYIQCKSNYTGGWDTIQIRNRKKLPSNLTLSPLYEGEIQIKPQKLAFLRNLAKCLQNPGNVRYYTSLQSGQEESTSSGSGEVELDSDDNSSGAED